MSDTEATSPDALTELDAIGLSALLSSRVCHDLINPVGAIESGLQVLDDPDMGASMREAALDLIKSGARKSVALLSFARLAYGAAGGFGAEIKLADAREALSGVFDFAKAELDWRLDGDMAAKENVKALMIVAHAAADCAPYGGCVVVEGRPADFAIKVTGKKILFQDGLRRALAGETQDLAPKFTPALIAAQLVRSKGGSLTAEESESMLHIEVKIPE